MSYFPLDRDLLTSSTWAQGSPEAVKVWIYLLLAANPRTGVVEDADPALALRCGLPLAATTAALDWLCSPDPYSRTRDFDGRRLERLPAGGFRILNYVRRRDKDHSTPRWRRWKERQRAANAPTVANAAANDEHEHENEHGKNGTDSAPAGAAGRPRKEKPSKSATANGTNGTGAGKDRGGWVGEAARAWEAASGGTAPAPGRLGKALKPLVDRHGEAAVLDAWGRFVGGPDRRFGAEHFASNYGIYTGAQAPGRRPTVAEQTVAAVRAVVAAERGAS